MPIAINGSGTVTGISTGGISDTKAVADAAMPAGSIIQVVQVVHSAQVSTTGVTYVDTGLSGSITPSSSSNKILITVSIPWFIKRSTDQARGGIRLLRGSTVIEQGPNSGTSPDSEPAGLGKSTNLGGVTQTAGRYSLTFLDSPSTTSAVTYKTQMANHQSSASPEIYVNGTDHTSGQDGASFITLMEVTV